jgi:hypothetical protein
MTTAGQDFLLQAVERFEHRSSAQRLKRASDMAIRSIRDDVISL